jgi:hypothetical protein
MRRFKLRSIVILLFAAQAAHGQGIVFVQQETRDGKTTTNQIQLDKSHIRAESHASGEAAAVVFDAQAQVVRMINIDKKTYSEIDKAQLEQMKQRMDGAMGQMSAAQKQMEEQLKNMPPEQRAMVEQMMRGRGGMPGGMMGMPGAAAQARPEYRAAGSDKVGQWTCAKYEGFRGQEKVSEVCTVDPKVFGLTPADFEAARQLAEFMKTLAPQAADQGLAYGTPEEQGFPGMAVRRISYNGGKATSTSEIKEFRRETFSASTFAVPSGFTKQNLGMRP